MTNRFPRTAALLAIVGLLAGTSAAAATAVSHPAHTAIYAGGPVGKNPGCPTCAN